MLPGHIPLEILGCSVLTLLILLLYLLLNLERPWSHDDSWDKNKECDHMVLFYVIRHDCETWHGSLCEPRVLETDIS